MSRFKNATSDEARIGNALFDVIDGLKYDDQLTHACNLLSTLIVSNYGGSEVALAAAIAHAADHIGRQSRAKREVYLAARESGIHVKH